MQTIGKVESRAGEGDPCLRAWRIPGYCTSAIVPEERLASRRAAAPSRNSLGASACARDTVGVPPLLEALVTELERPRELTAQVMNHLAGTYGLTRDRIGTFLTVEMSGLEDYEVDLILSPLFTPGLRDQAVFAELLGQESVPAGQWPGLIQQLAKLPARARLVSADGQTHTVPLREVTLERYVHRLRLDATIPPPLFELIQHLPPAADRPLLMAVARRAVWQNEARRELLVHYLSATAGREDFRLDDALQLLKLVETYEPTNRQDLLGRIPHWQQVLRQAIHEAAGPRPFFNERVEELHGGGRDQRRQDLARVTAREEELNFLGRLQRVLAGGIDGCSPRGGL
jgi:hypothetical protein